MKKTYLGSIVIILAFVFLTFALAQDNGRRLSATLTGATEVPGPGDTDGTGTVIVTLNQGRNQVCIDLSVANIAAPTAAHIHEAPAGKSGPVVVTMTQLPAPFGTTSMHNAHGAMPSPTSTPTGTPTPGPTPSPTPGSGTPTPTPISGFGITNVCVSADADLIKRIRQNPENFYFNVHNADFPDGAIRGQLGKK